jgi:HME family heavy-metal exporter/cobalt-zinc-cadmium resistance protein CzcA
MLARLIDFSLRQRALVLMAACALALAGAWAYVHLPIDAFPDISPTQVKVILKVPGMTPEEVEQRVSTPVEQELLGLPNKTLVRSVSKYGISDVTVDFTEGTDVYWARSRSPSGWPDCSATCPPRPKAGWRPSPRRWARCSCSQWMARTGRWPSAAMCWTGSSAPRCAPWPAWPM